MRQTKKEIEEWLHANGNDVLSYIADRMASSDAQPRTAMARSERMEQLVQDVATQELGWSPSVVEEIGGQIPNAMIKQ